jgi:hypothetical protein
MSKLSCTLRCLVLTIGIGLAIGCHQKMRVIVPTASWEPIFFHSINSVARLSDQADLRSTQLPAGDIETRIWWGFGLSPLEGVTLHRSGGQWTAIHVKADNYYEPIKAERRQLSNPKSGWKTTWTLLVNERLLSLPDASEINCNEGGLDAPAMVVEINSDNTYRTYMYHMSSEPKCNGDKNIMAMIDIIYEEFNLKSS